ncbi:MAG TPA: hypothetical protein VF147_15075 [Vicinamibacterales bacterium]
MKTLTLTAILAVALAGSAAAQMQHAQGMDHRGHQAMGWDQSKAKHTFATADNGGSIEVKANDPNDAMTVAAIRSHLAEIARSFTAGDFDKPQFIHAQTPPGVPEMKRLKADITYTYQDMHAGGKVTIASANPDAIKAVHDFLKFQGTEHAGK